MLKQYRVRDYRFRLVCYVFAITIIGILVIGSAEKSVQDQQILGMVLGTAAMIAVSLIDYNWILKFHWLIYAFNLLLLLLVVLTPLGYENNGATRWLRLGGFRFQPSELCKLCLILFFAKFLEKYKEILNTWKILGLSALLFGIPAVLVEQQPDLSTTISLCVIFLILLFIGGLSWKLIGGALAVGIPASVIFISLIMQPDQTLIDGYQRTRILAWLNPAAYANDAYQQQNSIMAIGSGQLVGKGLNNNLVSSVKNGSFIAEPQTDFIFAVAGEELGFIGCATIILLLALIV